MTVMVVSSTASTSRTTGKAPVLYTAAAIGALLACFELYLVLRWVTGPNFQEVTYGPTDPPTWMKVAVHVAEVVFLVVGLAVVYRFVVRPWRRERRIGFDGLMVLATIVSSVYDPLNSYFHTWFAYNSYFVNRGTAMSEFPGWQSFSEPGAQLAWPILFVPPLYAALFLGLAALGCALMRWARTRWPRLPGVALVPMVFALIFVMDIVIESQIIMRLGFYEETGWSFAWVDGYYSHNPLRNMLLIGVVFTAASFLRFYRNDRGETIVERGAYRVPGGTVKVTVLRFFAVLTAMQAILFFGYHLPMAITTLVDPKAAWHADMVDNSYLNNHICGVGTPRACPSG